MLCASVEVCDGAIPLTLASCCGPVFFKFSASVVSRSMVTLTLSCGAKPQRRTVI